MTDLVRHHEVQGLSDRIALGFTKFLRFLADTFFCRMRDDDGWIGELLEEAENERMHLMAFVALFKPNWFERFLVLMAQGAFWNAYFLLYLFAPRTAHRAIGYFEEEAIISYTEFLKEIDAGNVANVAAPRLAIDYWKMAPDARLRDLVIAVRDDEARHRDVNHDFAARLDQTKAQGAQIGEGDAMLAENREQNRPAA